MLISLSLVLIAVVMTMLAPSPSAASARSAGTHYSNSEHSVFVTDLHGISGRAACIVEHKLYDWLGKPHHKLSRCTAVDGKPILVTHSWEGYRLSLNRSEELVLSRKHTSFVATGFSGGRSVAAELGELGRVCCQGS